MAADRDFPPNAFVKAIRFSAMTFKIGGRYFIVLAMDLERHRGYLAGPY